MVTEPHNPLDNPVFFREFVKLLNNSPNPEYDVWIIRDLCDKFAIQPETVMARLHAFLLSSSRVQ